MQYKSILVVMPLCLVLAVFQRHAMLDVFTMRLIAKLRG